jgi:hypothetical protein
MQNIERDGLIRKIFRNKDLIDVISFEDMPEDGRLARVAVPIVSASGLVGGRNESPTSSWALIIEDARVGRCDKAHSGFKPSRTIDRRLNRLGSH